MASGCQVFFLFFSFHYIVNRTSEGNKTECCKQNNDICYSHLIVPHHKHVKSLDIQLKRYGSIIQINHVANILASMDLVKLFVCYAHKGCVRVPRCPIWQYYNKS